MSAELEPSDPLPTASVALDELNPYYRNPRHGDVGAIAESLELLGQYRHVVVNVGTFTDRPMEIAAGNHTVEAMRHLGWKEASVSYVDVDEETLSRIVLVDNRTNDLATYDSTELASMLYELVESGQGLFATGYDEDALDEMMNDLERSMAEELRDELPLPDLDRIPFRFGDFSGVVGRSLYVRFETHYAAALEENPAVMLEDVLDEWLPDAES